jgi:hypothetical protein
MNENYQYQQEEMLTSMVQPKKIIEHFGNDISEIRTWADLSSKEELLVSIKAFKKEGLTEYLEVLNESLNNKK